MSYTNGIWSYYRKFNHKILWRTEHHTNNNQEVTHNEKNKDGGLLPHKHR